MYYYVPAVNNNYNNKITYTHHTHLQKRTQIDRMINQKYKAIAHQLFH